MTIANGMTLTLTGRTYGYRDACKALGLKWDGLRWTGIVSGAVLEAANVGPEFAGRESSAAAAIRYGIERGEIHNGGSVGRPSAPGGSNNWRRADGSLHYDC